MLTLLALVSLACLVAVWALYPAVIGVVAEIRRRRDSLSNDRGGSLPLVTAIVATRADASAVRERVEDLLRCAYPAELLEVIVAYDARTSDAIAAWPGADGARVRFVRGDQPGGKATALNAGVLAARGEVLVFADSGQRFGSDAIPQLVEAMRRPGVGAASGRLELASGAAAPSLPVRVYWSLERWLRRREAEVHSTVGVTGAIYAMRRSLWVPLPSGLILDDLYVPMQIVLAGHRVEFVDDARAYETRATSDVDEYRRKVRTLTGVWQLCAWLPQTLVPVRNPVWAQFVMHKLLRLFTPYWFFICVVWAAVTLGRLVGAGWLIAILASVAALLQLRTKFIRALRSAVVSSILLQVAVVRATANGARRQWDVWHV